MAKKGLENFTDKVAKDLIKKQSIRDEQRKIREEYLENKYKEASDLTNDIEVYIESLNNIININPNVISIEEFIKRDIQDVPKELLVPYTKTIELSLRKPTLLEKISKKSKQKYNLYIQQENEKYEKEYKLYEENENDSFPDRASLYGEGRNDQSGRFRSGPIPSETVYFFLRTGSFESSDAAGVFKSSRSLSGQEGFPFPDPSLYRKESHGYEALCQKALSFF